MNRMILACILATASLSSAASQRQPVNVGGAVVSRGGEMFCSTDQACDDGVYCNGVERCRKSDPQARSGRCVAGAPPCEEGVTCDEVNDRCLTRPGCAVSDADGDGYDSIACGGNDCDDKDAGRNPGETEVCDAAGRDEDCDVKTFGDKDEDGDGFIDAMCR